MDTPKIENVKGAIAPRPPKKTELKLRVKYTIDEIVNLARKLAEATAELQTAEADKKAITSQLKAKSEAIQGRINEMSGNINAGSEYRDVVCEIRYDEPKTFLKSTVRLDTMEVVNVEPMSMSERQGELPLSESVVPFGVKLEIPERQPLLITAFDYKPEQIHVGEFDEADCQKFADWLRLIFVSDSGEMNSDTDRQTQAAQLGNFESIHDLESFANWMFLAGLPGCDVAKGLIETQLYQIKEAAKLKASKKKAPKPTKLVSPEGVVATPDDGNVFPDESESKT